MTGPLEKFLVPSNTFIFFYYFVFFFGFKQINMKKVVTMHIFTSFSMVQLRGSSPQSMLIHHVSVKSHNSTSINTFNRVTLSFTSAFT